jgi:hypothetical protein
VAEQPSHQGTGETFPLRSDELIDEAGEESFPASDPPATWSGMDQRDANTDRALGSSTR